MQILPSLTLHGVATVSLRIDEKRELECVFKRRRSEKQNTGVQQLRHTGPEVINNALNFSCFLLFYCLRREVILEETSR